MCDVTHEQLSHMTYKKITKILLFPHSNGSTDSSHMIIFCELVLHVLPGKNISDILTELIKKDNLSEICTKVMGKLFMYDITHLGPVASVRISIALVITTFKCI